MAKRTDRLDIPMTIEWNHKKSTRRVFLSHLIEENNFKTFVEVGVRRGGTTFHILNHFPEVKVYAIDTDIRQFYNDEVKERFGDRLMPMNMTSEEAADEIDDNSVDLIFIDACHLYHCVKSDIVKYTPKLKEGGILCGHDIDYPGVNRAVNELIESYDVGPNNVWIKR